MKILQEKVTYSGTAVCPQCECKLQYEDDDVHRDMTLTMGYPYYYKYLICPKCNYHISIDDDETGIS